MKIAAFRFKPKIQTRFYYDIGDLDHFVILSAIEPIIRASDAARGYVDRNWVIRKYKNAISHIRLTKRSCLVEYFVDSLLTNSIPVERRRVFVR